MIVIDCHQPTYFDIDRTLLSWFPVPEETQGAVRVTVDGKPKYYMPHKMHLKQLHAHLARGHTVVVWSAGGSKWAKAVAESLGLDKTDVVVMEKPHWIYDDKEASSFMPKADFLEDKAFAEHAK